MTDKTMRAWRIHNYGGLDAMRLDSMPVSAASAGEPWQDAIATGLGKPGTAMMAKGGAASLSDAEVKAIVDMMVAKAK